MAKGETNEALTYYDAAIARDPSDYLTFFKRATTYLSLGRTSQATSDFNKVLQLRPGFEGAHLQLGKLKAKAADWEGAKKEYLSANQKTDSHDLERLAEAEGAARLAEAAFAAGEWEECATQAGEAILVANRAVHLRELRATCRFERGQIEEGMSDMQHILQMRPGDTKPHLKISATTFYGLGDMNQGLAQIKKCLQSDPDSKPCKKMMKQEKAVEKTWTRVNKALEKKQPMSGVKLLVPSGEDQGLIEEVKGQIDELKKDGIMPEHSPSALLTQLVEAACQAYYEVCCPPSFQLSKWRNNTNEHSSLGQRRQSKHILSRSLKVRREFALRSPAPSQNTDGCRGLRALHSDAQEGIGSTARQERPHQPSNAKGTSSSQAQQNQRLLQSPRRLARRRRSPDQIGLPESLETKPPGQGREAGSHERGRREEDGGR